MATANVWRTLAAHPGYVLMRSIARIDFARNAMVAVQTSLRKSLNSCLRTLQQQRSPFFADVDTASIAGGVDRDGFALGLTLPPPLLMALLDFARDNPCWAERDPRLGFLPQQLERARASLGRDFLIAQYFNARTRSPLIAQLSRDPVLLEIAARYLHAAPTLVGVNMWWSYPVRGSAIDHSHAAQMFHYDLDDFKFIKFFFYLTDVDADAGPHVIVRGSHRERYRASLRDSLRVRRYSDEEISRAYGDDRVVRITGPAGSGFAEDTLAIHKGEVPTGRARLLLQFQYALNDFGIQHDDVEESRLAMIA